MVKTYSLCLYVEKGNETPRAYPLILFETPRQRSHPSRNWGLVGSMDPALLLVTDLLLTPVDLDRSQCKRPFFVREPGSFPGSVDTICGGWISSGVEHSLNLV